MRFPAACYQMLETVDEHFASCLLPSQRRGLVYWVYGTVLARSACQTMVTAALLPVCQRGVHTVRQYLREWLYDGDDKAAPCGTEVTITACFAPLMRWVLSLWQGDQVVLAIDLTNLHDRLHALSACVLYRGCAIPVAWHLRRGGEKGAWTPEFVRLFDHLAPAIPADLQVLVLMDAGLRSPALWDAVRVHGWHVLQRHETALNFRPAGWHTFHHATQFVRTPGHAWVGTGTAFKHASTRRTATLIVVWEEGTPAPWVLLTDLAPSAVGVTWYGLRMWVELGFRALKGMGWHWERTRRIDATRAERHWLVLAVATCWVLACGTRVEDAAVVGRSPTQLQTVPSTASAASPRTRRLSVFLLGVNALLDQFIRGRLWQRLWLAPDSWPPAPPGLAIWYDFSAHELPI